jgi:hypothetical protein
MITYTTAGSWPSTLRLPGLTRQGKARNGKEKFEEGKEGKEGKESEGK